MATKSKKRKAKKATGAAKARKAPAKKSRAKSKAKPAAKRAKKIAKPTSKKVAKAARRAVPKKAAAKKPARKQKTIGEGDYEASRVFLRDQGNFVKKNQARISTMGKEAEKALDGPEGTDLRAAEAEAASHARTGTED